MNRKGKLYFLYGTMGSAKTALLLTTAYNFEERKMKYVCLKPVVDTRDLTNVIKSRIGIQRECKWIYHETDLYELAQSLFEESMAVIDWKKLLSDYRLLLFSLFKLFVLPIIGTLIVKQVISNEVICGVTMVMSSPL